MEERRGPGGGFQRGGEAQEERLSAGDASVEERRRASAEERPSAEEKTRDQNPGGHCEEC